LLIGDLEFRTKLNATLAADLRLAGPQSRSSADQYDVVYGIVIKSQRPIELPLFSKVCLRHARRRLIGYSYKVTLKKNNRST